MNKLARLAGHRKAGHGDAWRCRHGMVGRSQDWHGKAGGEMRGMTRRGKSWHGRHGLACLASRCESSRGRARQERPGGAEHGVDGRGRRGVARSGRVGMGWARQA
jgi:hypothetical protein